MQVSAQVFSVILSLAVTLALSSRHAEALPYTWAWHWDPPLTGRELLLELEFKTNKQVRGIYAADPEGGSVRLLIPGGERAVWSPRRNYISYLMGDELRITRRDGKSDEYYDWAVRSDFENPHEPSLVWAPNEAGFARVVHSLFGRDVIELHEPLRPEEPLWTDEYTTSLSCITIYDPLGKAPPEDPLFRPSYNSPTFSPDGKMACEIYPAKPLGRSESRIYVVEFRTLKEVPRDGSNPNLLLKKRLTDWPPGTIELQPLWSPTGEWIAFLGAELKPMDWARIARQSFVDTYVCAWPGKEIFKLNFGLEVMIPRNGGRQWAGRDLQSEDRVGNLIAVEWSPDGKRLLLKQPDEAMYPIYVAQWNGKDWEAKYLRETRGRQCVFGPDSRWVATVDGADRPTYSEDMVFITNVDSSDTKQVKLPPGCRVLWMDW